MEKPFVCKFSVQKESPWNVFHGRVEKEDQAKVFTCVPTDPSLARVAGACADTFACTFFSWVCSACLACCIGLLASTAAGGAAGVAEEACIFDLFLKS